MKKAEGKREPLLASLGDLNRPLRVRPVRYMGREWWAVDEEDIWPGMVMDLRRLGFEAVAMGVEVLVREGASYEPKMDGPAIPAGLKPFPEIHPTIQIRKQYSTMYTDPSADPIYLDAYDDDDYVEDEDEDELELEDLDAQ